MGYILEFKNSVKKDFEKIGKSEAIKIKAKIEQFASELNNKTEQEYIKTGKIKFLSGELGGLFRLRIGVYRVIYVKDNEKISIYVLKIGHRKDVYK